MQIDEPGERVEDIVWDCQWVDKRCTTCSIYHVLQIGAMPPKCPHGLDQRWRVMWKNEKQKEHIEKIFDSFQAEKQTRRLRDERGQS